jgi:hypothetical protein
MCQRLPHPQGVDNATTLGAATLEINTPIRWRIVAGSVVALLFFIHKASLAQSQS